MASAIGTALISTILNTVKAMSKAKEIIVDKAMDKGTTMVIDKVDGMVNIERDIAKLQNTLCTIEGIAQEAEKKEIDNVFIQNWLSDLVDIAYEARDVLDDFITFSSCDITAEEASNPVNFISSLMLSYFGGSSSDTSKLPLAILNRLEKDIRSVRERFDDKIKNSESFATLKSVLPKGSESVRECRRPEVGPYLNQQGDYKFVEREEKQQIMEKLLHPSDDNRVHVVAIWGMGGIGKTTLAQSIYNDPSVKEHDHPIKNRRWLYVGENKFSAEKVIREMIDDQKTTGIGKLQEKVVKELRGDRFLIVLDDVWDVDRSEWDLLFNPLTNVGKGGLIIITTRKCEVCTAINTQTTYDLKLLSEQDAWSIFEKCAYNDGKSDSTPDLKSIGKKIVKKLNGLPLALKLVGCSLLNEDASTWENFLESNNDWMLINNDNDNNATRSTLRWIYNHLPRHLKTCFTYCALFPKDHIFIENVLVEMWMVHDLIQKEKQKQLEDVGAHYFKQLVNASLLQCVDGKYVMHDLIHDLALLVSNEEFAESSLTNDDMEKVRHITIRPNDYSKIPRLCKMEKLLTLYTTGYEICTTEKFDYSVLADVFKQSKSIRVLVLASSKIYNIPDCIGELRHLRYLDVSRTRVQRLPDSLCHLYHLQVLAARPDVILPKGIVNMVNLRHVRANLSTCKGVGKLTSLQELSSICVCKDDNIRELGDMQRLHGELTIQDLGNVEKLEDDDGVLMEKQTDIDKLILLSFKDSGESTISEKVLEVLGCPPNLKYLKIVGYDGLKPPRWMVDRKHTFDKLQILELSDCDMLESLPPLGELPSLKHLSLWNVGVMRLGDEFYGKFSESKVFFPSLELLVFYDMKGWVKWDNIIIMNSSVSFFPRLTGLEIKECAKLVSVLPVVKNRTSKRKREDKHLIMNAADFMTSLSSLKICNCHGLKWLQLDALVSLKGLDISHCSSLVKITSGICLATTLERLQIYNCELLKKMDFERLPSIKHFDIRSCNKLISVPCLQAGIKFLCLHACESLKALTVNVDGLDSLEDLTILSCRVLELVLEEGSSSSSPSGKSVAVPLRICTDKKQIFTKLLQYKFVSLETLTITRFTKFEDFSETEANNFCELKSLKILRISTLDLKSFPTHFHKLSSLNSLKIDNCLKLQSLPPDFHKLSSLKRLKIISCPQLQSLPSDFHKISSLESLYISDCPQIQPLPENFHKLSSLKSLHIQHLPQIQSLPENFHNLSSLKRLKIISCELFQSLPPYIHKLSSLKSLHIEYLPQLQSLPGNFQKLSSLEKLHIYDCPQLRSLPANFHKLSSLVSLYIRSCPQLKSFPELGLPRSVESLKISDCLLLQERCIHVSGLDWHKIKHIHEIRLMPWKDYDDDDDYDNEDDKDDYDYDNDDDDVDYDNEDDEDDDEKEEDEDDDDDDDDEEMDLDDTEYLVRPVVQAEEEEEEHTSDFESGQEKGTPVASMIFTIVKPMADKAKEIVKSMLKEIVKDKAKDFMVVVQVDGHVNIMTEISNLQIALNRIEEKQIDQNLLRDLFDIGYEARNVLDEFITLSSCIAAEGDSCRGRFSKPIKFISSRISFMQSYFNIGGSSSDPRELQLKVQSRYAKYIELVRERFKKKESNIITRLNTPVGGSSESALIEKYKRLPPHLKMCFTYCFLFPKDHALDEKVLVEMWIAHDLIQREEEKRPEDVGAEYFKQLVKDSLLQSIEGKYMMHVDVIHDPVLLVSKEEFATTNGSLSSDQMENVRHITITSYDYSNISSLCKSKKLLTLHTTYSGDTTCSSEEYTERFDDYSKEDTVSTDDHVISNFFKQLKSIRVLVLSCKDIKGIPDCISELIHLRYLDISRTRVRNLSDSFCYLYNLQMLAAPLDAKLPRDIVNMVNLRYLRANLPTCQGVGELTSLQELSSISVCKDDNIRELGGMQLLRGKLTIKGLENVTSSEDVAGTSMEKQILMDQLELVFDKENSRDTTISEEVLNALGCPPNLKYLKIVGYNGLELPRWMQDGKHQFDKLQTLEVSNCYKLESLPPLGELTSLKYLSLKSLHGVQRLGDEFYGKFTMNKVFFPVLESLRFYDMQEWEEWDDITINNSNVLFFARLTSLEILFCPKLVLVLPTIKTLKRKLGKDKHPITNAANFMESLSRLEIRDCHGLKRLQLDALESLKDLGISECSSLVRITSSICLASTVERLQISKTLDFENFPNASTVLHLEIQHCHKLISVPRLLGIKFLKLDGCESLKSLSIDIRGLNSLEDLSISDCPVLELEFEEGSSSSSSGNSAAVRLHISTDKKQIFTKLFQHEFVSLESLDIESVTEIENFSDTEENNFCRLGSLKSLRISRCKDLKSLPAHFHNLSSLNSLTIENCLKLQSLSSDFHKLSSLKRLEIISCPRLQSLPSDFDKLNSLQSLHINVCSQLQSLPARGFPPFMESLDILNCPLLYERCKDESGCDWHKIRHIPKITIFGEHNVHRYGGDW